MVFSYHLTKYPYRLAYKLMRLAGKAKQTVFYCREIQDWEAFEPVQKYLKPLALVSNKPEVRKYFQERHIHVRNLPVFPKAVIMARHSSTSFPQMR